MNKKIGFIGCGKMAGAIIKGILSTCTKLNVDIIGSEVNNEIAELAQTKLGIPVISDNRKLAAEAEIIVIATKPNYVTQVLEEIKNEITENKLIVSIAAGISISKIENVIPKSRIIRVMPNTPALVQEGMSAVCKGSTATNDDVEIVKNLLLNVGKVIEVEESQIDIVTAISGSGPAFFYQIIEDIAKAGEKIGLDYEKSLTLATQTALGSAKMIFNRGNLPVQTLIDNVATKGGCTFVGISTMKDEKSEELFYNVIKNTTQKASELGK